MGYDQGVVSNTEDSGNCTSRDVEARFIEKGQYMILEGHSRLLGPSSEMVCVRSPGGVLF